MHCKFPHLQEEVGTLPDLNKEELSTKREAISLPIVVSIVNFPRQHLTKIKSKTLLVSEKKISKFLDVVVNKNHLV
jgi:hypothetical protein